MTIDGRPVEQIVIAGDEDEVLAVISDNEIIERDGISVTIDWI